MRAATERLIRSLKGDARYALPAGLSDRDLFEILRRRGFEVFRGLWVGRRMGTAQIPLFAGRRVVIRHGHLITVGRSCILADDVLLDGLGRVGIRFGANVSIGRGSTLVCTGVIARLGEGIWIGDRTGIAEHAHIEGQGGVRIGSDVLMGPGVRVFSENHRFRDLDRPIRDQGEEPAPVEIGDDCWIGSGTIILAGVHIGRGTVIGAGSIVTRDIPAGSIAVGSPARIVGRRDLDQQEATEAEHQRAYPAQQQTGPVYPCASERAAGGGQR